MDEKDEKEFNEFVDEVIAHIESVRKRILDSGNVCGTWLVKGFLQNILDKL